MFKIKFLLIISSILIFASVNSNSQTVTFSARNTKNNEIIKLDSVKVMNLTRKKDTVLKGNFSLDLSVFTDVENQVTRNSSPFSISQNYPNSFENETRFSVNLPECSTLNLSVRNIFGEQVCSFNQFFSPGYYTFQLNGSGLTSGIFFISVAATDKTKVIKIMKIGNSSNSIASLDYISNVIPTATFAFLPGDKFDFIGYARNKVDTLLNMIPKGGENYEFGLEFLSPWYFSSGKVEIGGIEVIIEKSLTNYDSNGNPEDPYVSYDTTQINFSFNFTNHVLPKGTDLYDNLNCSRCESIENIQDTVIFCYENFNLSGMYPKEYQYCIQMNVSLVIDSSKFLINKLNFYQQQNNKNFIQNCPKIITETYKYNLQNIPYTRLDNNALISNLY
jgi:hypothetical protein